MEWETFFCLFPEAQKMFTALDLLRRWLLEPINFIRGAILFGYYIQFEISLFKTMKYKKRFESEARNRCFTLHAKI